MLVKWNQIRSMRLRIRVRIQPKAPTLTQRGVALTASQWTTPLSVAASVFAFWRLGSDIDESVRFAISGGLFSHWQVWLAMAVLLQIVGSMLARYGRGDGAAMP